MRRSFTTLFAALSLLVVACGNGNDTPDGGTEDAGGATIGEACPGGDPLQCDDRICLSGQSGATYCSAYCDLVLGDPCPTDFPCQRYLFGDNGGNPADLRDVCAPRCNSDTQCQSGTCVLPQGVCAAAALGVQAAGEPCGGSAGVCEPGNVCLDVQGALQCVVTCDPAASAFCADGRFCWSANVPEGGRCWPGGSSEAGDPCTDHLDCGLGLLCILQNGESTCRIGCDPEDIGPRCAGTTVCLPLEGRSYGFCQG